MNYYLLLTSQSILILKTRYEDHKQPKKSPLTCTKQSLRITVLNKSLVIVQLPSLVQLLKTSLQFKTNQQSIDQLEILQFKLSHLFRHSLLIQAINLLVNNNLVCYSLNLKKSFANQLNLQLKIKDLPITIVILSLNLQEFLTNVWLLKMTQTPLTLSAKMVKNLKVVSKRKKNLFVF